MKYAVIDIGSNSVRLMLWADGKTLYKKVSTTRLSEGLDGSGRICSAAIDRTALAVKDFAAEGKKQGAEVFAFATAAVRSAVNGAEFCEKVKDLCGISVDVVSGADEARLAVLGALKDDDGGIIDIGGASTEISVIEGGKPVYSHSFNIGAVRLHDSCGENAEKLKARIEAELVGLPLGYDNFYAVGGTASTLASMRQALAKYDAEKLQGTILTRDWIHETTAQLFSLSVEERRNLKGMDPARADILAGAAMLLETIMEKMGLFEVSFSDRDNLEGYLALKGLQ